MVRGPRLQISPDGQVPQRIREAELWLGGHPNHPAWLRTDDGEQSCWTPWGKTRRDIGRGRLRPIRRHAAVSGQGAGRRRTAVDAGAPECAAGRRGVRSRRAPRHSGVVSGAQLSRLQPQAAGGAGSVQGTGRVPVRGAQCRADARAEGFKPRPFVGLLYDQSEADGLRALFTTRITTPQQDLDVLVPAVIDGAIHYVRSGQEEIRRRSRDGARVGRALSRRHRRAGLAAADRISLKAPGSGGRSRRATARWCARACAPSPYRSHTRRSSAGYQRESGGGARPDGRR